MTLLPMGEGVKLVTAGAEVRYRQLASDIELRMTFQSRDELKALLFESERGDRLLEALEEATGLMLVPVARLGESER